MNAPTFGNRTVKDELDFRSYELNELLTSFRRVLMNPGEAIARVILVGPSGSGKSFLLENFQEKIQHGRIINSETKMSLSCISVDCASHDSTKSLIYDVIRKFDPFFQVSLADCCSAQLQYDLADILQKENTALVIVFDNIDTLVAKDPEEVNSMLYGFQRFSEGKDGSEPNLFSQILVAQELSFIADLDRAVFRRVVSDVIEFQPYSAEQVVDLLQRYIRKKHFQSKISEETVWFVAMLSQGNMRRAKELVAKAFSLAQKENSKYVLPEHVRTVNSKLSNFSITNQIIAELPIGEKLLLLAIARRFKGNNKAFIDFIHIPGMFFSICEEYQQWQTAKFFSSHLQHLQDLSILSRYNHTDNIIVILSDISAAELVTKLEPLIKIQRKDSEYYT